jgi:hypothetical protein
MKYVCIDSNVYRHIYSRSKDFSDDVKTVLLKLIENEKVKLFLPLQVKQEVERDRFGEWCQNEASALDRRIKEKDTQIADLQ